MIIQRPEDINLLTRINQALHSKKVDFQAEKMGESYTWANLSCEEKWHFPAYRKAFYMVEVLMCLVQFKGPMDTEIFFERIRTPSPDKKTYQEVCNEINYLINKLTFELTLTG